MMKKHEIFATKLDLKFLAGYVQTACEAADAGDEESVATILQTLIEEAEDLKSNFRP